MSQLHGENNKWFYCAQQHISCLEQNYMGLLFENNGEKFFELRDWFMHLQLYKMYDFAGASHYAATILACQCDEHAS